MKRFLIPALGLLLCSSAFAQNLNPTVEVTNAYAREASGIDKPAQLLELPDSILRFNLDFEYAVNETPYQGAYEFTPYLVQFRPQSEISRERSLYLRAGVGYTLHPELAVIYTPVHTGRFHLNLFGDHHSFIGRYEDGMQDGMELKSRVGADASLDWGSGSLRSGVEYGHVLGTSLSGERLGNHRVQAQVRISSLPGRTRVSYDLGTQLRFISAPAGMQEFYSLSRLALGARVLGRQFRIGLQAETVSQPDGTAASFEATLPRYTYSNRRSSLTAGLKLAFILRSEASFMSSPGGFIFPDVQASVSLVPGRAVLYGSVTGGNELISYGFLLDRNPFIAGFDWKSDVKEQRILASLGLRGNVASRFHYDVSGGYSWIENLWMWGTIATTAAPALRYASPIHTAFAKLDAGWKNSFLDIGAYVKYVKILNEPGFSAEWVPFSLPAFSFNGHAFYNWGERIRAGVTAEGRSEMSSSMGKLPAYVDIGLQAQFRMTPALGFWGKAGNLLNQSVQRVPFYAEKGPYFTLGFTWNL